MNDLPAQMDNFVKPTTDFWQEILAADDPSAQIDPPYRYRYPAKLRNGRHLMLPLRVLPDGNRAAASLIANHASFSVINELATEMSNLARTANVDQIVGMPTLGLAFAPSIAEDLGFANYVPLGYSRKFWYRDNLSQPVNSITTPGAGKSVYIDPNIVPRLKGRRVAVVDDAISSGSTIVSVLKLLRSLDCDVAVILVAMIQGVRWRMGLEEVGPTTPDLVKGAFSTPLFQRTDQGWVPEPGSLHIP
jgi:adenine/guanine phosphoribosyltransferase-like PRPP-binding protein